MTTPRAPLLTRAFVLVGFSHFLHCLAFNLFLHLPGFLRVRGATELTIGWIFGATAATAIAARPPMGRVMDARGRRFIIVWGGALHAAVCLLYLTVGTVGPWVYAVRIAHGLAEAALFTALFALAADLVPAARRIEGIALFGVSGMLPISLGAVLGDAILARRGYGALFVVATVFALGGLLLSLPVRDPPLSAEARGAGPSRGFFAAAGQRDLAPLWFIGLAFATALAGHFVFLKTYVMATHVGTVGSFFTPYSLAAIALRVGGGTLPDRVGPKRVLFPAMLALGVGLLVLSQAHHTWQVVVAGLLCGAGHGYAFPIMLGMVVARARPSERGSALALFTSLFDAGMLVGGPVLGAVAQGASYGAMFVVAAVMVFAGAGVFAVWDTGRR